MRKLIVLYIGVLLAIACSSLVKINEASFDRTRGQRMSEEFNMVIVADNQFHVPSGREYYFKNYITDKVVSVAVRPPHSTIFGPFAFESMLTRLPNDIDLILNLGDVADVSCPQEFSKFLEIMGKQQKPWAFAPGNHDGYFTGNSQHDSSNKKPWDYACGNPPSRLDKAMVVRDYVKEKYKQDVGTEIIEGGDDFTQLQAEPQFRFAAQVLPKEPHKSFVIQQIRFRISKNKFGRIILFDTAQYKKPPKFRRIIEGRLAGLNGEYLDNQKKYAEKWIKDASDSSDLLILAAHFPLQSLIKKEWIIEQLAAPLTPLYLSAHTHHGGMRNISKGTAELNVPSLVDWPLGMRFLTIQDNKISSKELLFSAQKPPYWIGDPLKIDATWQIPQNDFYHYKYYSTLKHTGPTGRVMHHYLLLAELKLLKDAIKEFTKPNANEPQTWIAETERSIGEFKSAFDKPLKNSSADEIEKLRPLVDLALKRYNDLMQNLPADARERADLYNWCQLAWAAEADFQHRTKKNAVEWRELGKGWRNDTSWSSERPD